MNNQNLMQVMMLQGQQVILADRAWLVESLTPGRAECIQDAYRVQYVLYSYCIPTTSLGARRDYADPCYTIGIIPVQCASRKSPTGPLDHGN